MSTKGSSVSLCVWVYNEARDTKHGTESRYERREVAEVSLAALAEMLAEHYA